MLYDSALCEIIENANYLIVEKNENYGSVRGRYEIFLRMNMKRPSGSDGNIPQLDRYQVTQLYAFSKFNEYVRFYYMQIIQQKKNEF